MKAIIYTSNTGSAAHYAKLLAEKVNLPVYNLKEAKKKVLADEEIVYLGGIMAGKIKGYSNAIKKYNIRAVGMG